MKIRVLGMSLLVAAVSVVLVSPASATGSCNGASTIPRVGLVSVSAGDHCVLGAADQATYVNVAAGGSLILQDARATQVISQGQVTIANSTVSGSVVVQGVTNGPSRICSSIIGGYLVLSGNTSAVNVAPTAECPISNFVAQGVVVAANKGPVFLHALSIFGFLYCWGNAIPPAVGAVTTLPPGQFYGQCAR